MNKKDFDISYYAMSSSLVMCGLFLGVMVGLNEIKVLPLVGVLISCILFYKSTKLFFKYINGKLQGNNTN